MAEPGRWEEFITSNLVMNNNHHRPQTTTRRTNVMNSSRTATRIPRVAASVCALGLAAITLTACGGSDASAADGTSSADAKSSAEQFIQISQPGISPIDDLRIMEVDGNTITFTNKGCGASRYAENSPDMVVKEKKTSVGSITEDRTSVVWTQPGEYENRSDVQFVDGAISINGTGSARTYVDIDSDGAKAFIKEKTDRCRKSYEFYKKEIAKNGVQPTTY